MKLGKSLLFLVSTVIGAVSVGSTGLALTKHKPSQTERDVIELEDLQNDIKEEEIQPSPAPLPPPPPPPSEQGGSSGSSDTDSSASGESPGGSSDPGTTEQEDSVEETEEAGEEEDEDDEDDEDTQDNQDQQQQDSQDQSDTDPPTEDEIKKSLKEVIEALIEKKDFDIKVAGLFDTYTVSTKLSTLQQLITQYKTLKANNPQGVGGAGGTPGQGGGTGNTAG